MTRSQHEQSVSDRKIRREEAPIFARVRWMLILVNSGKHTEWRCAQRKRCSGREKGSRKQEVATKKPGRISSSFLGQLRSCRINGMWSESASNCNVTPGG